jgi:hypothetical protein
MKKLKNTIYKKRMRNKLNCKLFLILPRDLRKIAELKK